MSARRKPRVGEACGRCLRAMTPFVGMALVAACADATRPEGPDPEFALATALPVAGLELTPDSAFIEVGAAQQFTATVVDSLGDTVSVYVSFAIEDTAVAVVDTTGLVTGLSPGSTVLHASGGGVEDVSFVTVHQVDPAARIAILIDDVETLSDEGAFKGRQANGVLAKLNAAIAALAAGDLAAAVESLDDFVNQVGAVLSAEDSQPLIDLAESIIDQLAP